ncbi:DUF2249 domain-containing protein [Halobaculum halobium]|uniref:DUF2249 domain-containing protein n=1 Tax=Halobaculum halobium TaxID=3032281 RepID=A0ABD5TDA2_9EURY|nr:DUF2249 domain-containing protein [Halobaculum sp. SYNS20]
MAHADTDADGTSAGTEAGSAIDADAPRVLDVRETDAPPFEPITSALADLEGDGTLVIVNSFEPEPLYAELDRLGFTYRATRAGENEWRVTVERE